MPEVLKRKWQCHACRRPLNDRPSDGGACIQQYVTNNIVLHEPPASPPALLVEFERAVDCAIAARDKFKALQTELAALKAGAASAQQLCEAMAALLAAGNEKRAAFDAYNALNSRVMGGEVPKHELGLYLHSMMRFIDGQL